MVFVALAPFTSPIGEEAKNDPDWNSKVTAPPIPHVFNTLMTLSIVTKSPVGPTE